MLRVKHTTSKQHTSNQNNIKSRKSKQ
eukprot:UN04870